MRIKVNHYYLRRLNFAMNKKWQGKIMLSVPKKKALDKRMIELTIYFIGPFWMVFFIWNNPPPQICPNREFKANKVQYCKKYSPTQKCLMDTFLDISLI